MKEKYPFRAVIVDTKEMFTITSIDFDNQQVYHTTSQTGSGEWHSLEDVYVMENGMNSTDLHTLILNSDINYENYDKIDGKNTIYDNDFHPDAGKAALIDDLSALVKRMPAQELRNLIKKITK